MTTRKTAILRAREREASWTELREQRALRGLLFRLRNAEARPSAPRRLWLYAAAAAAVVALGVGATWRFTQTAAGVSTLAVAPAPRPTETRALNDGSSLQLAPGAEARVVQQAPEAVSVRQLSGRVAYRVAHNPRRSFVVLAGGVEIHVRGTEFSVDFAEDRVAVQVRSGRVEVHDGERVTTLVSGEDLRVHAYSPRHAPPSPSTGSEGKSTTQPTRAAPVRGAPLARVEPAQDTDRVDALFRTANQARADGRPSQAAAD